MIRRATKEDIASIVKIYNAILDKEEAGETQIGWVRGVYPTEETALDSLEKQTLFVCEDEGTIVATAKIDQSQMAQYMECEWEYKVPDCEVMVLHTLAVDPNYARRGYGRALVAFYEQYALENQCHYLRMDTNEKNLPARKMYNDLGYTEVGIVEGVFNGIPGVHLVCLEKKV